MIEVSVARQNGMIRLFVDGEAVSPMLGRLALPGDLAREKLDQYHHAGIEVYMTEPNTFPNALYWDGRDRYDYRPLDSYLAPIVERVPDIRLIMWVGTTGRAPYYWCRDNEEELGLLSNGDRLVQPSLASIKWREDSAAAYAELVGWVERSPYADNVIGYNPCMYANEWITISSRPDPPPNMDDYSRPMLVFFRSYLRRRYDDDEIALRRAWNDPNVTFDTADIPDPETRLTEYPNAVVESETKHGFRVADFNRCLGEASATAAVAACRSLKQAMTVPRLCSLMHGNKPGAEIILDSPYVDLLNAPYDYSNRHKAHLSGYAVDSIRAHGKLYADQTDSGTHVMPESPGYELGLSGIWTPPKLAWSPEETVRVLTRDVAYGLTRNLHCYWNEGGPGGMFPIIPHGAKTWSRFWYDNPECRDLIPRLKALVDDNAASGARQVTDMAVFTSQNSDVMLPKGSPVSALGGMIGFKQKTMSRVGAPFDDYLLEDFAAVARPYKVYVFLTGTHLDVESRRRIVAKLAADRATALWFYAPGLVDEAGADIANAAELTGIEFTRIDRRGPIQVVLDRRRRDHPLVSGPGVPGEYGSGTAITGKMLRRGDDSRSAVSFPAVFVARAEGTSGPEVLGLLAPTVGATPDESPGAGLAVAEHSAGYRSVWSAAPQLPWQIINNLLSWSGVHVYNRDGDQLTANSRYVALFAQTPGKKTIHLPESTIVTDALSGKSVGDNVDSISFDTDAGNTRVFRLGP